MTILDGLSVATGLARPSAGGLLDCVRLNDVEVRTLPDLGLSARCGKGYAGFVFYSLEDPAGDGGKTLPDTVALSITQRLLRLRPNCRPVPYIIPWHGWPVMYASPIPPAFSKTTLEHYRLIRDHNGAVAPEVYPGEYTRDADAMKEYARRITKHSAAAFASGWVSKLAGMVGAGEKPCPVMPTVWWNRAWPMYDNPGAPLTDLEIGSIEEGIELGGGCGLVLAGWLKTADEVAQFQKSPAALIAAA